ncbi:MAG: hypothetical protein Phog2KO_07910 [Phototrophicaceae bacterium]
MDFLVDFHNILFSMQTLYSMLIGFYAAWLGAQGNPLSGNFFGTVAVYAILNFFILIIGMILLSAGYTIEAGGRIVIYVLYMVFLIIILPGIFSIMRGRDDKSAAMIFGASAIFNAAVSYSMFGRGLANWILLA